MPGTEIMESKRGFTINDYEKFTNDQLEIELNGSVTIKSIQKFNDVNDTVLDYVSENLFLYFLIKHFYIIKF